MKKVFMFLLFILFIMPCFAEVYITIDSQTREIKSMDKRDDCVVQSGWEKIVLPGKLTDYPLQYHPTYYKYNANGQFIVNIQKISDEALEQEEEKKAAQEEQEIQNKMKAMAIQELKNEGKQIKYHNDDGSKKED